ncbi:MAG: hypothetical protein HZA91_19085 [Verrucomicrobia bacterium]|nr:hypothetical protein [Verrucomicrobiota bacterium]
MRRSTTIRLRRHGKQGRFGFARWTLLAWIGLLFVVLVIVFVSLFMGRHWVSGTDSDNPSATTSAPSHTTPQTRPASTAKQEKDSAGSAVKDATVDATATPDVAVLRAARLAANRQALRSPVKRRDKPVGSPSQATTPPPDTVPAASGLATAVVEVDGESYELFTNQVGYFDRVRVEPQQKIPVVVNYPEATGSEYF